MAVKAKAVDGATAKVRKSKGKDRGMVHLETLKIEYVGIDSISPNPYNPNEQDEHAFELLLRSIEDDGFTQPIIVNEANRLIVDGEHRWTAAKQLGFQSIPVVFVNMSDTQARLSTLRHNKARGSHDIGLEASILRDLAALGATEIVREALALSDSELERMLIEVPAMVGLTDDVTGFSQAWTPSRDPSLYPGDNEGLLASASTGAARSAADILQRQRTAITDADREALRQEARGAFRLSVVFSGEEAIIVKEALGGDPANALLELCRQAVASRLQA